MDNLSALSTPRRRPATTPSKSDPLGPIIPFSTPATIRRGTAFDPSYTQPANFHERFENEMREEVDELIVPQFLADSREIKKKVSEFMREIDENISMWKGFISASRNEQLVKTNFVLEKRKLVKAEIAELNSKISEITKRLEKEKDVEKGKSESIKSTEKKIKQEKLVEEQLSFELEQLNFKLSTTEQDLNSRNESLAMMNSLVLHELKLLERVTGLKIDGEKECELSFTFTNLVKNYPQVAARFKLSFPTFYYEVPYCNPSIPDLNTLLDELNESRDIFAFLKNIRKSFYSVLNSTA